MSSDPAVPAPGGTIDLDVAVVGAGPAGASAALVLASGGEGLRIGLLEKAVPPRYKTCGGGVLRRAAARLPIGLQTAVERECRVAELIHHAPVLHFGCRREEPIVHMVMRDRFDFLLTLAAESAGAELFAGTAVLDVVPSAEHVLLETTAGRFRARFVVAADGVNSTIARKTHRPELRDVAAAFECEFTPQAGVLARFASAARFDFGLVPAGYGWVFPKENHLSMGVLTTRRGAAHLPEHFRRYCDVLAVGRPIHEERHGHAIPCRARRGLFDVPRVLFAGDAAGLADPVLAEGITAGIASGQLAARAILEGNLDVASVQPLYWAMLDAEVLAELRVARVLARLLYDYPRVRVALLSRHGQALSELMVRIATGETSYREAVRRPRNFLRLFRW